jgi:hypothetical protein
MRDLRRILLAAALALFATSTTTATRCGRIGRPCEEVANADFVFIGSVLATRMVDGEVLVDLAVEDQVKGAMAERVTVGGTWPDRMLRADATGYYVPRERYVFYAHQRNRQLEVDVCSRTRPRALADEDVAYFRQYEGEPRLSSIVGIVHTHGENIPWTATGIRVVIEGNGIHREAGLDAVGEYDFGGLEPGDYTVRLAAPAGYFSRIESRTVSVHRSCQRVDFALVSE